MPDPCLQGIKTKLKIVLIVRKPVAVYWFSYDVRVLSFYNLFNGYKKVKTSAKMFNAVGIWKSLIMIILGSPRIQIY